MRRSWSAICLPAAASKPWRGDHGAYFERTGAFVPGHDCHLRLVEVRELRVEEAALTGESEAVLKDAATLREPAALGDRLDMVEKAGRSGTDAVIVGADPGSKAGKARELGVAILDEAAFRELIMQG